MLEDLYEKNGVEVLKRTEVEGSARGDSMT